MFITPAHAQDAAAAAQGGQFISLLPIILIFVVFYFLIIRPQQRKFKQHQDMVSNLRRGDKVVTNGGLIGTIARVDDHELLLDISENVTVRLKKQAIANLESKPEPVPANEAGSKDSAAKAKKAVTKKTVNKE